MESLPAVSVLRLGFVVPRPDLIISQWAEMRLLIDGRDVLEEMHPGGVSSCWRGRWFGRPEEWPLAASDEPRRVELTNNDCVTDCCGGTFVTIQRRADRVVWTGWENTEDIRLPVPADVHFGAAAYDAELARAVADLSWEEPVDSVARLMTLELAESGCFERWGCGVNTVYPLRRQESAQVVVHFSPLEAPYSIGSTFVHEVPVSRDVPAEEQVRRFVDMVAADDPRATAGVLG
ncbi:hypothetical protein [Streptomyces virginiae]|uniref:hypothetical protein n=1 Tax=Streptomyces virginiae TaxID=1961 RepID=UPI00225BAFC2|nr:hypothetical protein [Streptomyces virginiae]MCX4962400.1 hypothetical protein [Streptomyces virginiae]